MSHTSISGKDIEGLNVKVPSPKEEAKSTSTLMSPFQKLLLPVLRSLMFIGIQTTLPKDYKNLSEHKFRLRWWNILVLICIHLGCLRSVAAVYFDEGGLGFWVPVSACIRWFVATLSADVYVHNQAKIHSLIRKVDHTYVQFSPEQKKKFKNLINRSVVIMWVFVFFNIFGTIFRYYMWGAKKFLKIHFFSMEVKFLPPVSLFITGAILMLAQQFIMWGTLGFMVMLYIAFCLAVKYSFISFNRTMGTPFYNKTVLDSNSLRQLEKEFFYITELIQQIDDVFSPAVFFWSLAFILNICIDITFDIAWFKEIDIYSVLASVQKLIIWTIAYAAIGFSASFAMEEGKNCLQIFYKLSTSIESAKNVQIALAMQFFAMQLSTTRFCLTGWKFFEINRNYMMAVVGLIVSYTIIVFQMNPHAMSEIIKI